MASSSPLLFPFFFYRSNFGHLSLHINPGSPHKEPEFSFPDTLYQQCLHRPPGGRAQETFGFGWQRPEDCDDCQDCRSVLSLGLGVRERIWGQFPGGAVSCHSPPHLPVGAITSPLYHWRNFLPGPPALSSPSPKLFPMPPTTQRSLMPD